MLVAVVRRDNNRVVSFSEGSARSCRRRECGEFYVFRDFPSDIDRLKCWEVVGGELVEFTPPVLARHIKEARFQEFRTVTDPMTTGGRPLPAEWAKYAQDLRDITNDGETVPAMLARWPKRPGKGSAAVDAVAHLRGRE